MNNTVRVFPTIVLAAASAHWVLVDSQNNETTLNKKNNTNSGQLKPHLNPRRCQSWECFFCLFFLEQLSKQGVLERPPTPTPLLT